MAPSDASRLVTSRAGRDGACRLFLLEVRISKLLGASSWELIEDANALRRATEQLVAMLACAP